MKTNFIIFLLFVLSAGAFAQTKTTSANDRIYKADNTVIDCKITEVTTTEIKYKKASYLDGPTYSILKSEVVTIQYANGESEVMTPVNRPTTTSVAPKQPTSTPIPTATPTKPEETSSAHYKEFTVPVFFSSDTWIGFQYNWYWRLSGDSKPSNHYLGIGAGFFYGPSVTGDFQGTSVAASTTTYDVISFPIPITYQFFPTRSNFYVEGVVTPRVDVYQTKDNIVSVYGSATNVQSDVAFNVGTGINIGYIVKSTFDFFLRAHSFYGVGLGIGITGLERHKR